MAAIDLAARTGLAVKASIITTAAFALVGVAYFTYLNAVAFPSDLVRAVPFIWLAGAAFGLERGARSLRAPAVPIPAWIVVAAGLLNLVLAGIFCLAAAMGD